MGSGRKVRPLTTSSKPKHTHHERSHRTTRILSWNLVLRRSSLHSPVPRVSPPDDESPRAREDSPRLSPQEVITPQPETPNPMTQRQDPEEMFKFILSELEFQSQQQRSKALLYGFAGGVLGFSLCMIIAACTMKPEPVPPVLEPRAAVLTEEVRI